MTGPIALGNGWKRLWRHSYRWGARWFVRDAGAGWKAALAEMWRVLKPGGVLHLTTDVAVEPQDAYDDELVYGEASTGEGDRVFFKRDYTPAVLADMVAQQSWTERHRECVVQRDPGLEQRFYDRAPWSDVYGPLLRWRCPCNFTIAPSPELLTGHDHGVVYRQLVKASAQDIG